MDPNALPTERDEGATRISETLVRMSVTLTAELDHDALMQKLTEEATTLCRAEFGAFFYNVINDRGESYMLYTLSGVPREKFAGFPMPRNTAIFEPTFSGETVVRSADVTKDPRYGHNAPYHGMPAGHLPVRSYLALPVKARSGEVLGGLFFGHSAVGVFTQQDEELLTATASIASVAIENARLYRAVRTAEARARSEHEALRSLFNQAPAFISIQRGPEHVVDFVNTVAETLLEGREVIGKPLREVLPSLDPRALAVLDHVLATGEPYAGRALPIEGEGLPAVHVAERYFDFVLEPYHGPEGTIAGTISFGFDVTEQVRARRKLELAVEQLEVAARMKDEFLATVSHELRTPLNAILGWTRLLRSGSLSSERQASALDTIERNAHAQTRLIEDLLDVSRIISGKLRLSLEPVDLPGVVEAAIEATRPAAAAKDISIAQTLDPDAGPVLGDPDRLRQVMWNLLSNAMKFVPRGGKVAVVVCRRDSTVEIVVRDNGQGIDPAFLPHVFERFRQADATTTRSYGGLGLGLAIVRHLVEQHGGSVLAESPGLGRGATFTITLPISAVRARDSAPGPAAQLLSKESEVVCPPELSGLHVLLIDDEPDARELIAELLTRCHAKVMTAGTSQEALRLSEDDPPDLIVSDIGLPGEDGYAFIRALRSRTPECGGRAPAVALTAYARREDRTKALLAGFNTHVAKPVDPAELMLVLQRLASLVPRPT